MPAITSYTMKDGRKRYQLQAYLGTDPNTGKRVRVTRRGFDSEKEAQLEYARLLLEQDAGNDLGRVNRQKFKEVYKEWFEVYKVTVKESTVRSTMTFFERYILPAFGDMYIDQIRLQHVQEAINRWSKVHSKASIIKNYTSHVFKHAIRVHGSIEKNPCDYVRMPKRPQHPDREEPERNFYTVEELRAFLEILRERKSRLWYTYFQLLAYTGLRRGEALALRWGDIDLAGHSLSVKRTLATGLEHKTIISTPKSLTSKRTIALDPGTVSVLKQWRVDQMEQWGALGFKTAGKEQPVFSSVKSNEFLSLSQPGHELDRITRQHGLRRITPHGFRHTHCSILFEAGASIKEVQERLGHTDVHTTMNIYAHVSPRKKDETAQRFADYMSG